MFRLLACAMLLAALGCDPRAGGPVPASDATTARPDARIVFQDAGTTTEPPPTDPPAACLPGVPCANDGHCPDGHLCNLAMDPPACTLLYCATEGSACWASEVCAPEHYCSGLRCTRCAQCGDNPCVNLSTDSLNCGSCGVRVGDNELCLAGQPRCIYDVESNPEHCGECGHQCSFGAICDAGRCLFSLWSDPGRSCDVQCGEQEATCVEDAAETPTAEYTTPCAREIFTVPITCATIADTSVLEEGSGCEGTLDHLNCPCVEASAR